MHPDESPKTPNRPPPTAPKKLPQPLSIQSRKIIPPMVTTPSTPSQSPNTNLLPSSTFSSTMSSEREALFLGGQEKGKGVGDGDRNVRTPTQEILFQSSDKFYEKYEVKEILGHGSSGLVNKCIKKDNNRVYVVKRTKCQPQQIQTMKTSYNLIQTLSHPNILKYKSLYISPSQHKSHLVTEYYPYPTLTQHLESLPNFPNFQFQQQQLQIIVYQLLDAIAYMHKMGICHRDVKPDNVLYDGKGKMIKVVDFGVSRGIGVGVGKKMMLTCTGTTEYKAPELFCSGYYDQLIDQWAAGVTIYKLITGKTPFSSSQYIKQTIQNIQNCNLTFPQQIWQQYSPFVKDLISSLVCPRPDRITAEQAKNSLWFKSGHQEFYQSFKPRKSKKEDLLMSSVHVVGGRIGDKGGEKGGDGLRKSLPFLTGQINQEESDYDFSDEEIEDSNYESQSKKKQDKKAKNEKQILMKKISIPQSPTQQQ